MTRSLFCLVAVATTFLYLATTILALGIPADLAKNASQVTIRAEDQGKNFGLLARGVRGIPIDLFQMFQLMAQYSAAAYCFNNNNSPDDLIACRTANCPLVEAAGARSVAEFQDTPVTDDTGFIAVDETNRLIVLSFRGTISSANIDTDIGLMLTDTDLCAGCQVHQGFWTAWLEVRDTITPQVIHEIKKHPDFRFAITGHSLGGALATLAAGALRDVSDDLRERTELYSFGAPRVGNKFVAQYLTLQSDRSYRITNRMDPVPRLPPWPTDYHQTKPEYYIHHHSSDPTPTQFEVLLEPHDGGNGKTGNFLAWKKHDSYFMEDISACKHGHDDRS